MKRITLSKISAPGCTKYIESTRAGLEQGFMAAGYQVVDRRGLGSVLKEQRLQLSGVVNAKETVKVGAILGAEAMVAVSSLNRACSDWRMKIIDIETGAILVNSTMEGRRPDTKAARSWINKIKQELK